MKNITYITGNLEKHRHGNTCQVKIYSVKNGTEKPSNKKMY